MDIKELQKINVNRNVCFACGQTLQKIPMLATVVEYCHNCENNTTQIIEPKLDNIEINTGSSNHFSLVTSEKVELIVDLQGDGENIQKKISTLPHYYNDETVTNHLPKFAKKLYYVSVSAPLNFNKIKVQVDPSEVIGMYLYGFMSKLKLDLSKYKNLGYLSTAIHKLDSWNGSEEWDLLVESKKCPIKVLEIIGNASSTGMNFSQLPTRLSALHIKGDSIPTKDYVEILRTIKRSPAGRPQWLEIRLDPSTPLSPTVIKGLRDLIEDITLHHLGHLEVFINGAKLKPGP